jgi:SPP1 gp7 family putative phage head morphogenesis protein
MIKILKSIHIKKEYYDFIETEMVQKLYNLIFKPIFEILNVKIPRRVNSPADIKNALRAGRIFWQEGYFYGEFNAVIGKALRDIGASFDSRKKAYALDINRIPLDMRTDLAIGKGLNRAKTDRVMKHLDSLAKTKLVIGAGDAAVSMMDDLNVQAIKTLKVLPENLEIPLDLTDKQQIQLTKDYQAHLDLYFNNWKDEQILRLREKIEANAILGYRADRLAKIVQNEFGVTQSHAKLIARQEASIFVSKYRQERYTEAGALEYIWSTSHDERVRHDPKGQDHKSLNDKKFSWKEGAVVDHATGERANPGEPINCRCLALPIIRIGTN